MAESLQIGKMNHRHEGVLRWLLGNPDKPLSECARELGYTQTHLSIIIHSDAFQAALRSAQGELNSEIALSIHDKMTGLAHAALDKLSTTIPIATDPRFILDVAESTLNNLGYGNKKGIGINPQGNVTINNYMGNITPAELAAARDKAREVRTITVEPEALSEGEIEKGESAALPATT